MIVHTEPAEWWQVVLAFTPLAAFLVILAAVIALYAFRLPASAGVTGSEMRADSWDRTAWALDMALDESPHRRKVGLAVLEQLSASRLMGKEDTKIVAQARDLLNRR